MGGAIYLLDAVENKRTDDPVDKYYIQGSVFENIESYLGGALFLEHPQSMIITDCKFSNLRAMNRSNA